MLYEEFVKGTGIESDSVYEDANTIYMNACESMSKDDIYRISTALSWNDFSIIAETIKKEQEKAFKAQQEAEDWKKGYSDSMQRIADLQKLIQDIRLALSKKNIDIYEEYRNSIAQECYDKAYYDAGKELINAGLKGDEE